MLTVKLILSKFSRKLLVIDIKKTPEDFTIIFLKDGNDI